LRTHTLRCDAHALRFSCLRTTRFYHYHQFPAVHTGSHACYVRVCGLPLFSVYTRSVILGYSVTHLCVYCPATLPRFTFTFTGYRVLLLGSLLRFRFMQLLRLRVRTCVHYTFTRLVYFTRFTYLCAAPRSFLATHFAALPFFTVLCTFHIAVVRLCTRLPCRFWLYVYGYVLVPVRTRGTRGCAHVLHCRAVLLVCAPLHLRAALHILPQDVRTHAGCRSSPTWITISTCIPTYLRISRTTAHVAGCCTRLPHTKTHTTATVWVLAG